jgi:hypothetical protein
MPLGVVPVAPERTGKPPKTVEEFLDVLTHWVRNEPDLQQDGQRQAYEDYVSRTILLAKDYGLSIGLSYHAEVVKALRHHPFPLYDPYIHGPVFQSAHFTLVHGKPKLGTATRSGFTRKGGSKSTSTAADSTTGKKRKTSSSPDALCSVSGHVGHTNADCRWQQQQLKQQQPKKKAKGSAPATPAATDSD